MKLVKRITKLPVAYCFMPWVRHVRHRQFVDCNEPKEKELIDTLKAILRGEKDVSEFDNECEFILALKIPDDVESCDGTTERIFNVEFFKWDVPDVACLVEGFMPVGNSGISAAGFSEKELLRLANPRHSSVDFIEGLETHSGRVKCHYLTSNGKRKLRELEKRFSAKAKLSQKRDQLADPLRDPQKIRNSTGGKIRNEILQDHNYTCIFCGRASPDVLLHVHHIIPKSIIKKLHLDEGLYTCRWNFVCACMECNLAKSDTLAPQDVKFFIEKIESGKLEKNRRLLPALKRFADLRQSDGT